MENGYWLIVPKVHTGQEQHQGLKQNHEKKIYALKNFVSPVVCGNARTVMSQNVSIKVASGWIGVLGRRTAATIHGVDDYVSGI